MTKNQRGAIGLGATLAGFNLLVPAAGHFVVAPFAVGDGGRWGVIAVSWALASFVPPALIGRGPRPAAIAALIGGGVHAMVSLAALSF